MSLGLQAEQTTEPALGVAAHGGVDVLLRVGALGPLPVESDEVLGQLLGGLETMMDVLDGGVHGGLGPTDDMFDLLVPVDDLLAKEAIVQHGVEDVVVLEGQAQTLDALLDVGQGQVEVVGGLLEEGVDLGDVGLQDAPDDAVVGPDHSSMEEMHAKGDLGDDLGQGMEALVRPLTPAGHIGFMGAQML